jgi:peptidoglycan hydrolase CwlO-like protein
VIELLTRNRAATIRSLGAVAAVAAATAGLAIVPSASRGDLAGRYSAGQKQAGALRSEIGADSDRIRGFEGTISDLQGRLTAVQNSVAVQEQQLAAVQSQLTSARARLAALQAQYVRGRRVLAAELVADYESPPPNLVSVVVDSTGFNDLLNSVRNLQTIERHNAETVQAVKTERAAVAKQAAELAIVETQHQRATTAVLVERDDIAQLKLSIVDRELAVERDRSSKALRLTALRKTLTHEANVLDAQAARAQALASGGAPPAPGACVNTPFVFHGGPYGFFPASGTNYTVNQEPIIAGRLNALGLALHLHLIGISGYRSPEHSVEVGGFADDPHTRGEASDTPGVEGVPESTLLAYCLTRPFAGPREADHIQES